MIRDGEVLERLRGLRTEPPASLAGAVLGRVGLTPRYGVVETAVGPVYVAFTRAGISRMEPARIGARAFEEAYRRHTGQTPVPAEGDDPMLERVRRRLDGEGPAPAVDLRGLTEFERAVLKTALRIPRGEVRPYGWIAREIGKPRAVRAVGTALGRNPIPFVIPCHRVVRGDGTIGNYGYGTPMKRALLSAEGVDVPGLDDFSRRRIRYTGLVTTGIFCFPTCYHARRSNERNRVELHDEEEARAMGFRPCKHCRPAKAS